MIINIKNTQLMSIYVRRKKLKECDMSGTCGGDAGMSATTLSSFTIPGAGMGNVVPPAEGRLGSGDNFDALSKTPAVKSGILSGTTSKSNRYTVRKKKVKK